MGGSKKELEEKWKLIREQLHVVIKDVKSTNGLPIDEL